MFVDLFAFGEYRIIFAPNFIPCALETELTRGQFAPWAEDHGISLQYIQANNPHQNAYAERYNSKVRYDWLPQYLFDAMAQVPRFATPRLWAYNNERPNNALRGVALKQKLVLAA